MRKMSWLGGVALVTAGGLYLAHRPECVSDCAAPTSGGLVEAPVANGPMLAGADALDLAHIMPLTPSDAAMPETAEPPLAETVSVIRTVSFEKPMAESDGPELPPAPESVPAIVDAEVKPASAEVPAPEPLKIPESVKAADGDCCKGHGSAAKECCKASAKPTCVADCPRPGCCAKCECPDCPCCEACKAVKLCPESFVGPVRAEDYPRLFGLPVPAKAPVKASEGEESEPKTIVPVGAVEPMKKLHVDTTEVRPSDATPVGGGPF